MMELLISEKEKRKAEAMRLICASCGVVPTDSPPQQTQQTHAQERAADSTTTCAKCESPLHQPTVFDCARLGLFDELKQLIQEVTQRT